MLLRVTINPRRKSLAYEADEIEAPNAYDWADMIVCFILFPVVCFVDFPLMAVSGKLKRFVRYCNRKQTGM